MSDAKDDDDDDAEVQEWMNAPLGRPLADASAGEQCKHGEPIYPRCRSCEMDVVDEINNAHRKGMLTAYQDVLGRSKWMSAKELLDWLKERAEAK